MKPVLDHRVTVSPAWSASTLPRMTNPSPLGSGMLGGSSSFPSTCPKSLDVQSLLSKSDSSTTGSLRSNTPVDTRSAVGFQPWLEASSLGFGLSLDTLPHS